MKIYKPRELKPRPRSIDTVTSPEVVENPYAELERLLTPEVRDRLELGVGIENFQLLSGVTGAMILNQALHQPIPFDGIRLRSRAELVVNHPRMYAGSEINFQTLEKISASLQLYPQERGQLVISDGVFDQWLALLAERNPGGTGAARFHRATQMCVNLLHLRPDKFDALQELLRNKGWGQEIWREKTIEAGADATSVANLRVFEPSLVLTAEEKKGYMRAFDQASKSILSKPTFHGWASLAMLLAPSLEIDRQGNIILVKQPRKPAGGQGLPVRSAV